MNLIRSGLGLMLALLLAACGGGGDSTTTQVTVSLGGNAAVGAVQAAPPAGVQSIRVTALASRTGPILAGPATATLPILTVTLTVPNGSGIIFELEAFDAAGKRLYHGFSAPQTLNGTSVIVPITLSVEVNVTASSLSVLRLGSVNVTASALKDLLTPMPPVRKYIWSDDGRANGSILAVTAGAPAGSTDRYTWTAPNVPGVYTVMANINDPYQDPNLGGKVSITVQNRAPVATLSATALTMIGGTVSSSVQAFATDPDGDAVTFSLAPTAPGWATINATTGILMLAPQGAGTFPITVIPTDAFGMAGAPVTLTLSVSAAVVPDTTPPVVAPPAAIVVAAASAAGTPATQAAIAAFLKGATATDNIGVAALTHNAPATFPAGKATVVTFTAKDAAGNIGTATSSVTVQPFDLVAPVVTAPAAIVVAAVNAAGTPATNAAIAAFLAGATATDNVGVVGALTHNAPATFPIGATAVTFTARDAAGNVGTATATVTVADQAKPVVTVPANITVATAGATGTPATQAAIAAFLAGATATDNVGVVGAITHNGPATFPLGATTVTFSAKDAAGNVGTATAVVTVTDQAKPVVTAPLAITVAAVNAAGTPATDAAIAAFLAGATATDNVGVVGAITHNGPATFPLGATTVTFSAKDAAGNVGTATAVVTVTDQTAPVITLLGTNPLTIAAGSVYIDAGATASDNVDGNLTATIVTVNSVNPTLPGIYTVTYSVLDAAGNAALQVTRTVTVTDQTPPVVAPPISITVAAVNAAGAPATDPYIAAFLVGATATDNVGVVGAIVHNGPATFPLGATTVTFTATDAAGNAGTATAIVTVTDQTAPVVTAPAAITVAAVNAAGTPATNAAIAAFLAGATATDNVGVVGAVTHNGPATFPLGATIVTFTAKDAAGNAGIATAIVTVTDQTAPVVTAPLAITVAAVDMYGTPAANVAIAAFLAGATATDNVGVVGAITHNGPATFPLGATTVTFTAVDAAGNAGIAMAIVTITDQTAPVVTAPAAITVAAVNAAGTPATNAAIAAFLVGATAIDNVGVVGAVTHNGPATFPLGATTVTFTAVDAAGNAGIATAMVTVTDQTAPVVTAPAAITVAAVDLYGTTAANVAITAFLAGATATDNVGVVGAITHNGPATFPLGATTVTFTAVDAAGNAGIATAIVTVTDQTAPVVTAPLAITVAAVDMYGTPAANVAIAAFLAGATATDNVGVVGAITHNGPATFPLGATIVAFTATDAAGNAGTATATVTVTDQTAPVVTAPAAITVAAVNAAGTPATDAAIAAFLAGATATDNVGVVGAITHNGPAIFPLGTTIVTFTAKDAAGNTSMASSSVTVADQTAPVITLLGTNPLTIAAGSIYLDAGATATDNVGGVMNAAIVVTNTVNTLLPGIYTVSYNVTDAAGNPAVTVTRTVTVVDQTPPVVTPPISIAVAAVNAAGTPATDPYIAAFLNGATATDNVGVVGTIAHNGPATFPLGATTVTFTATDAAGNAGTATAIVTVTDQTAPVVIAPAAITVAAVNAAGTPATDAAIAAFLAGATATDNVGVVGAIAHNGPATFPLGATIVTFTATDAAGNAGTATATVTVTDQAAPVVTAPAAITVAAVNAAGTSATNAAIAAFLAGATATDNVAVVGAITHNGPATFPLGTTIVTFTAVDAAGNAGIATAMVTVTDQTAPVVIAPAAITVATVNAAGTPATDAAIAAFLAGATATDNVGVVGAITHNGPATFPLGATTVTFTAVDAAGNAGIATAIVTITDQTAPVVTAPLAITVAAVDMYGTPATNAAIAAFLAGATAIDNVGVVGAITNNAPATFPLGATTVTFTAVDAAGNAGTATAVVTVTDQTIPVISLLGTNPLTIAAGSFYLDAGATATDNVDGNITASIVTVNPVNTLVPGVYTVTYNVSDAAGNAAVQVTRTVTVTDQTPPVVTAPAAITVAAVDMYGTPATDPYIAAFLAGATATDNIGVVGAITHNGPATFPIGATTVTFTARDAAGNAGTATAVVTVVDQTPPTIAPPANISVVPYDDYGAPASDPAIAAFLSGVIASDNVAIANMSSNAPLQFPLGATTVSWTAVDTNGNSTTASATVTVGYAVTTLAGSAGVVGSADGVGTASSFNAPYGMASDGSNLFIADYQNHTIRKLVLATGVVSTFAGTPGVAGSVDGIGMAALFNGPVALAIDGNALYVSDHLSHIIRRIDLATATVTTLAGTAGVVGSSDGVGAAALFNFPIGLATDGASLFVADSSNRAIRRIDLATATVSTLAGSVGVIGSADGVGVAANFAWITGMTTDGTSLFAADGGLGVGNQTIRKIDISTAAVTTLAGQIGVFGSADGVGAAAQFNNPYGLFTDGAWLYVIDNQNHTLRRIAIDTGTVTTLAGTAGIAGTIDGIGAAARFNAPVGMTGDGAFLYLTEVGSNTLRKIALRNTNGMSTVTANLPGLVSDALVRFVPIVDSITGMPLGAPQMVLSKGGVATAKLRPGSYQVLVARNGVWSYEKNALGAPVVFNVLSNTPQTINLTVDVVPPAVTPPANIVVAAVDAGGVPATNGAIVAFLNGATASDNIGVVGAISRTAPTQFPLGVTPITFRAVDAAGNVGMATATVTVTDQTPPQITLLGNNPETINLGSAYADAGATASDLISGNLTASIVATSTVNTAQVGGYSVTYSVSDAAGNLATAVRTVNVVFIPPALQMQVNPVNGQTMATSQRISGLTEAGASIAIVNAFDPYAVVNTTIADGFGAFLIDLPLLPGANRFDLTATSPTTGGIATASVYVNRLAYAPGAAPWTLWNGTGVITVNDVATRGFANGVAIDGYSAWAVGYDYYATGGTAGVLFATHDRAATWTRSDLPQLSNIYNVAAGSTTTWLFGYNPATARNQIWSVDAAGVATLRYNDANSWLNGATMSVVPLAGGGEMVIIFGNGQWLDPVYGSWHYDRFMLKSSDGGLTWSEHRFGSGSTWPGVASASFVDGYTGFVQAGAQLWRTDDGGQTWLIKSNVLGWNSSIDFVDGYSGWAIAGSTVFRTGDGGLSWSAQNLPTTWSYGLRSLDGLDAYSAVAPDINLLWASQDGGASWQPQVESPDTWSYGHLGAIAFADRQFGVVAAGGNIFVTTGGGFANTGSVTGLVTGGGAPYSATLIFTPVVDPLTGQQLGVQQTVQSSNGQYTVNLMPGQYTVTANIGNNGPANVDPYTGMQAYTWTMPIDSYGVPLSIFVSDPYGATPSLFNIALQGPSVQGQVRDELGRPVPYAFVLINCGGFWSGALYSNELGWYQFLNAPDGACSLTASRNSGVYDTSYRIDDVTSTRNVALLANSVTLRQGTTQLADIRLLKRSSQPWDPALIAGDPRFFGVGSPGIDALGNPLGDPLLAWTFGYDNYAWIDPTLGVRTRNQGVADVTHDGGASWQRIEAPQLASINGMAMLDGYTGWVIGRDQPGQSVIADAYSQMPLFADSYGEFVAEFGIYARRLPTGGQRIWTFGHAIDPYTGMNGTYAATSGDGVNWSKSFLPLPGWWSVHAVDAIDANTLYVGMGGELFASLDGGQSWQLRGPIGNGWTSATFDFIDANNGWAVVSGEGSFVWHTVDGGISWQQAPNALTPLGSMLTDAVMVTPNHIILSGNSGAIVQSFDGGNSWSNSATADSHNLSHIASNGSHVYAASSTGQWWNPFDQIVLHSATAGMQASGLGSGTVRIGLAGAPVANATIVFDPIFDPLTGQWLGQQQVVASSNGSFTVTLAPGSYTMQAYDPVQYDLYGNLAPRQMLKSWLAAGGTGTSTLDPTQAGTITVDAYGTLPTSLDLYGFAHTMPNPNSLPGLMGGTMQTGALSPYLSGVTTFAGTIGIPGAVDSYALGSSFNGPTGLTTDGTSLFVADIWNSVIRKVDLASGNVSTLAGLAGNIGAVDGVGAPVRIGQPFGLTSDGKSLYAMQSSPWKIRRIDIATGMTTTLPGTDTIGIGGSWNDGALTTDGRSLFVSNGNSWWGGRVYRFDIASGSVVATYWRNAQAIATDGNSLYGADTSGTVWSVDLVTGAQRNIATVYGWPGGLTTDGSSLFVTCNQMVYRVEIATGAISTVAGLAGTAGAVDGANTTARFNSPYGLTSDGSNLYVADYGNAAIRKIAPAVGGLLTGQVTGNAGPVLANLTFDPLVDPVTGQVLGVRQMAVTDAAGNYSITLIAGTYRVRATPQTAGSFVPTLANDGYGAPLLLTAIGGTASPAPLNVALNPVLIGLHGGAAQGTPLAADLYGVTTIAGLAYSAGTVDGYGQAARFYKPQGIITDGVNLYVADRYNFTVRKVEIATGNTTTIAGWAGVAGMVDGYGLAAQFNSPLDLTSDGANIYITDYTNNAVRKLDPASGYVSTLATGVAGATGITHVGGKLYVGEWINGNIDQIDPVSGAVTPFVSLGFSSAWPAGIVSDGSSLYVGEFNSGAIRRIDLATRSISTLATIPGGIGFMTTDGSSLFVTSQDRRVHRVDLATGNKSIVAGIGIAGEIDGFASTAAFAQPQGITTDGQSLFVADHDGHTIRQIGNSFGGSTTGTIVNGPVLAAVTFHPIADPLTGQITGVQQTTVAVNGTYSINLQPGTYTVTATPQAGSSFVSTMANDGYGAPLLVSASGMGSAPNPANLTLNAAIPGLLGGNMQTPLAADLYGVVTLAGLANTAGSVDGYGAAARFQNPVDVASDGTWLYAVGEDHTVRRIDPASGAVVTMAGVAYAPGNSDGVGINAHFNRPLGIVTDGTNLFVADYGNNAIRRVDIATGRTMTVATVSGPHDVTIFGGKLYAVSYNSGDVVQIDIATGRTATIDSLRYNAWWGWYSYNPTGITTDGASLYVTTRSHYSNTTWATYNGDLFRIDLATHARSTIATGIYAPFNVTYNGGNLYMTSDLGHSVWRYDLAAGAATLVSGGVAGEIDGLSSVAQFNAPHGIATNGSSLFVTDYNGHTIRQIGNGFGGTTTGTIANGPVLATVTFHPIADPLTGQITGVQKTTVAVNGSYSISLQPGSYTVTATPGSGSALVSTMAVDGYGAPLLVSATGAGSTPNPVNLTLNAAIPGLVGGSMQALPLDPMLGQVTTIAGQVGLPGSIDGYATAAQFSSPREMTTDGSNLFVADAGNHVIRKMNLATGMVTTLAGSAGVAGNVDGTATAARFNWPHALTTDGTSLFVADWNNGLIRRVDIATGRTTTMAGIYSPHGITLLGSSLYAVSYYSGEVTKIDIATGRTTSIASLGWGSSYPSSIATDGTQLYVASQGNYLNSGTLYRIDPASYAVSTVTTGVYGSYALASDGYSLFVGSYQGHTVNRYDLATGNTSLVAGMQSAPGSADGFGAMARFNAPIGLTSDGGNLYVADYGNHTIRKIAPAVGSALSGTVAGPTVANITFALVDPLTGQLLGQQQTVQTVNGSYSVVLAPGTYSVTATPTATGSGFVSTLAKDGYGAPLRVTSTGGTALPNPLAISLNAAIPGLVGGSMQTGALSPWLGQVSTIAGHANWGGYGDGYAQASWFNGPESLTTDGTSLFVADLWNNAVRKIDLASGYVSTLTTAIYTPRGITFDGSNLFVTSCYGHAVYRVDPQSGAVRLLAGGPIGYVDNVGQWARFNYPAGILSDGVALYVGDTGNYRVRKIDIASGRVTTLYSGTNVHELAYDGVALYGTDWNGGRVLRIDPQSGASSVVAGGFNGPRGIATDGYSLFVAEGYGHDIRRVDIATGSVATVAGAYGLAGELDGVGSNAQFNFPLGIASDGSNLYVSDASGQTIRKIAPAFGGTLSGNVAHAGGPILAVLTFTPIPDPLTGQLLGVTQTVATDAAGNYTIQLFAGQYAVTATAQNGGTGTISTMARDAYGAPLLLTATGGAATPAPFNFASLAASLPGLVGGSMQGALNASLAQVSTLAGTAGATGSLDGYGAAAGFNNPNGLTSDGSSLFVSDYNNHTIRRIDLATGMVSTLAGSPGLAGSSDGFGAAARFNGPVGLTTDGTNLFVADHRNHTIRRIDIASGLVTTMAGWPGAAAPIDASGKMARFNLPHALTNDGQFLYVGDWSNNRVRKIEIATGAVSTLTWINGPYGLAFDGSNLYAIAYHDSRVYRLDRTTGAATSVASIDRPHSIVSDGASLFVTSHMNHALWRIDIASGAVARVAGQYGVAGSSDGIGIGALFNTPTGLASDGYSLYLADNANHTIRKIAAAGSALANGKVTNATGPVLLAFTPIPDPLTGQRLGMMQTVATDAAGNYSVQLVAGQYAVSATPTANGAGTVTTVASDIYGAPLRLTVSGAAATPLPFDLALSAPLAGLSGSSVQTPLSVVMGKVNTIAGGVGQPAFLDGYATSSRFYNPHGLATDGYSLYVADASNHSIRRIDLASGNVALLAGSGVPGVAGNIDGIGREARFNWPVALTTDGRNLYVADWGNSSVRKVEIATGRVTTLAWIPGNAHGIAWDGTKLFVTSYYNHAVYSVDPNSGVLGYVGGGWGNPWNYPSGITAHAGRLFVTTAWGNMYKLDPATGVGSLLTAMSAGWSNPTSDGVSLYASDEGNHRILKIDPLTGTSSVVAGGSYGWADGVGTNAMFRDPKGLASDGTYLYVADYNNHVIRRIADATGGIVAGTVNGAGGPLASVIFTPLIDPLTGQVLGVRQTAVADATGAYSVTLLAGTYTVTTAPAAGSGFVSTLANDGYGAPLLVSAAGGVALPNPLNLLPNAAIPGLVGGSMQTAPLAPTLGNVSTLAGAAGAMGSIDGYATTARFALPEGITTDGSNLYVADFGNHTIRKLNLATGMVSTLAGTTGTAGATNGIGVAARFSGPVAATTDGTNLYVADWNNNLVRKIDLATGHTTTLASIAHPYGLTILGAALYVTSHYYGEIRRIDLTTGAVTLLASLGAWWAYPIGITTDGTWLYVANYNLGTIYRIDPVNGASTTLASGISTPFGLACDGASLFVSTNPAHTVQRVDLATGAVALVAGSGAAGSLDGIGAAAQFNQPLGLTSDGTNLYVVDYANHTIRKIAP